MYHTYSYIYNHIIIYIPPIFNPTVSLHSYRPSYLSFEAQAGITLQVVGKCWCRMPRGIKWTRASTTLWRPGHVKFRSVRTLGLNIWKSGGIFTIKFVFDWTYMNRKYDIWTYVMINHEILRKQVSFSCVQVVDIFQNQYETSHPRWLWPMPKGPTFTAVGRDG